MKVGIGEFEIVAICPSKDQLNKILGTNYKKDIEYVREGGVKVVVVLKDVTSDFHCFATFELEKTLLKSKSGNFAFLNKAGNIAWATSEESLPATHFLNGEVIQLNKGEDLFYGLLSKVCSFAELDRSKWYKGNFLEVMGELSANVGASVVVDMTVQGAKNNVYTKQFILATEVDRFRNQVYGETYIKDLLQQDAKNKDKNVPRDEKKFFANWQKLLVTMNNPQYPCGSYFYNGYLKTYIPTDNPMETDEVLIK